MRHVRSQDAPQRILFGGEGEDSAAAGAGLNQATDKKSKL
jgi:hypothetical protein